jgi:hypothetical protein
VQQCPELLPRVAPRAGASKWLSPQRRRLTLCDHPRRRPRTQHRGTISPLSDLTSVYLRFLDLGSPAAPDNIDDVSRGQARHVAAKQENPEWHHQQQSNAGQASALRARKAKNETVCGPALCKLCR